MFARSISRVLIGVAVAASLVTGGVHLAASGSPQTQTQGKHYKATRAFVLDKQTGELRLPNAKEIDEVIANLSTLGQRPADTLQQSVQSNGAISLDLDGGFAGIVLARPGADGTWETRCVFTLEEGAAFLGIVEDEPVKG